MIRIDSFKGMTPAIEPRLLKAGTAAGAENCRLDTGSINPVKSVLIGDQFSDTTNSIYPVNSSLWKEFDEVNIVPIPSFIRDDDRYIYADGTGPRQGNASGDDFPLGVLAPTNALTASIIGTVYPPPITESLFLYPIGDSITKGTAGGDNFGFRDHLQDELTGNYDFVGEFSDPVSDPTYDVNHSGVDGDASTEMLVRVTANYDTYMSGVNGDNSIAIIHAGTNDIYDAGGGDGGDKVVTDAEIDTAVANVKSLVDFLHGKNPDVQVYVALIIPSTDNDWNANFVRFNTDLSVMLAAHTKTNLYEVDMHTAFTDVAGWATSLMADIWHPTDTGYQLMADMWSSAINTNVVAAPDDPDIIRTGIYVYTWVTDWNEESAPSEPSGPLDVLTGQGIQLTNFATPPVGHNITNVRIYRLVTGTAESAYQQLVDDLPISTTSHDDYLADDALLDIVLPSEGWDTPPDSLIGIIEYANNILIGFTEDEVYLSEPGFPHAWPYSHRLSNDIIGIANAGGAIFALTAGHPVLLTGSDPTMIQQSELPYDRPCVAERGIVSTQTGVVYPTNEGLFHLSADSGYLLTKGVYTREQWNKFDITNIIGFYYDDAYHAFFDDTPDALVFPLAEATGVTTVDVTSGMGYGTLDVVCGWADGETLFLLYDNISTGDADAFTLPHGTAILPAGDEILPAAPEETEGRWLFEFDSNSSDNGTFTYKTKTFYSDGYTYIGAIQLHCDTTVTVNIYTDGTLRQTIDISDNTVTPLTAGYLNRQFQFELISDTEIRPPFSAAKTIYELVQNG